MKRSVLIIKGFSKNETELINDQKIIQRYVDFFSSNAGGVFDKDNEIEIFEEPDLREIQALTSLNQNDYLIVVLIGHGANQNGVQVFQLQKDVLIYPGQIQFSCKKQLHILETCRNNVDMELEINRLNRLIPKYRYGGVIEVPLTREESLQKFNKAIEMSEDGVLYLFAASIEESAYDYIFLRSLIDVAVYFHEFHRNGIIGVQAVFRKAQKHVVETTKGKQNPVLSGSTDLPFAITII